MTAATLTIDLSRVEGLKQRGSKQIGRCPACASGGGDATGNHFYVGADGRWGCVKFAGDGAESKAHRAEVFRLIGVRDAANANGQRESRPLAAPDDSKLAPLKVTIIPDAPAVKPRIVAEFPYHDATGEVVFTVARLEPGRNGQKKEFPPYRTVDGKKVWNIEGVKRVLYRLPEVLAATGEVWIVEGERKADYLCDLGFYATCNLGGAGKWMDSYSAALAGKSVVICGDNDEPGRKHVKLVHVALAKIAASIRHVRIPEPHNDVVDFIAAMRAESKPDDEIRAAIESLLSRATPLPMGELAAGLLDMAGMERVYAEHAQRIEQTSFPLSRWLPSLGEMRNILPGELVMLLAETGVGKTMCLHNIAAAAIGLPTLIFEIELPETLTFERIASMTCKMAGRLVERTYQEGGIVPWREKELCKRLVVCSRSQITVADMRKVIQDTEALTGVRPVLVMLDYIQLVRGTSASRYDRISTVAEDLKTLAKEERCIVVVASQVHRKGEDTGGPIALTDGKESGSIENSSGVVIGVWRADGNPNKMMVRVLKNTKGKGHGDPIACDIDWATMRIEENVPRHEFSPEGDGV